MKFTSTSHALWGKFQAKSFIILLAAGIICLLLVAFAWNSGYGALTEGVGDAQVEAQQAGIQTAEKPIYDWYVCDDLGRGPVPGVTSIRYRVKLCHQDGWVVRAYCLRPLLEPPPLGTKCERTGPDSYWCSEFQPLREYIIKQTPPPTPTPTSTPTPTPTQTPTPRPPPGGPGFADLQLKNETSRLRILSRLITAREAAVGMVLTQLFPAITSPTPTPFQPYHPTPTATPTSEPVTETPTPTVQSAEADPSPTPEPEIQQARQPTMNFYGIDFSKSSQRIVIRIKPDNKRVNGGRPINIVFFPGAQCTIEDRTACVNAYTNANAAETIFVTVHSGIGMDGQAFRHAVEGTGYDKAAQSLNQVRQNLAALNGATVTIIQGDVIVSGLRLAATTRLPPHAINSYLGQPVEYALDAAALIDPSIPALVDENQPKIVFETCGWRMTRERWVPGTTNTSASIYLGVIQLAP